MESNMTPGENFIVAIIAQAIDDTTYTGVNKHKLRFKKDAIDWIIAPDPEFVNYCKMVGLDPKPIRNKIIKNVDMSYTQNQKTAIKNARKGVK
jgi:hypothetical protein